VNLLVTPAPGSIMQFERSNYIPYRGKRHKLA